MASPFVKTRADAPDRFFVAEAAGLRWLGEATALGGARVVRVIEVAPGRIVLERVVEGRSTANAARAFGRALATTHDAGARAFGARASGYDGPLYIGRRRMPASTSPTWSAFYAPNQVEPFIEPALAAGHLRVDEVALVRRACALIAEGALDDDEAPARIHGDLWTGNVLWDDGGAVLIDPAAHGGHRETDLAMLALFGTPHLDAIVEGYQSVHPLRAGWRARVPAHQLHPLGVHAAGHGRSYGVALAEAARRTLALGE